MWGLIASLYIGNAMLLVLDLPLAPVGVRLLMIPRPYLYGGIVTFALLGAWSVNSAVSGDPSIFLTRPIAAALLALTAIVLAVPLALRRARRRG